VMCDQLIRAALGRRLATAVPIPSMPA
jgi:hypothetical protein